MGRTCFFSIQRQPFVSLGQIFPPPLVPFPIFLVLYLLSLFLIPSLCLYGAN